MAPSPTGSRFLMPAHSLTADICPLISVFTFPLISVICANLRARPLSFPIHPSYSSQFSALLTFLPSHYLIFPPSNLLNFCSSLPLPFFSSRLLGAYRSALCAISAIIPVAFLRASTLFSKDLKQNRGPPKSGFQVICCHFLHQKPLERTPSSP